MSFFGIETAFARSAPIKSSVQKIKLVADLLRGEKASDALLQLKFCEKKVSKDIQCVLLSAISNAENNKGMDIDKVYIERILIGKSFSLKRSMARARGRAAPIKKPFSNITIVVSERG